MVNNLVGRWRTLLTYLLLAALVVVIIGKDGNGDHPLKGVQGSFRDTTHVILCFAIAGIAYLLACLPAGVRRPVAGAWSGVRALTAANLDSARRHVPVRYGFYLVLLAIAVLGPRALPGYLQQATFTAVGIYALLALGLNVVVGYAGLLDLGFIAFYAIGAYVTAYFVFTDAQQHHAVVLDRAGQPTTNHHSTPIPWHAPFHLNGFFVLPIALLAAAAAGVILGGPTLRLRGDYLAIVTLGFGEIVQLLANNEDGITNGSRGTIEPVPHLQFHAFGINYTFYKNPLDPLPSYYLLLGIIVLVMIAFSRLDRSRIGRAWAAIREDEVAAAATGVPTVRYKLLAFAIGASVSGFAGVIFATSQTFTPETFSLQASIFVVTVVIFGGMGSIFGVVTGAAVLQLLFTWLDHSSTIHIPAADSFIFFGAVVIIMMIFRPQGLIPSRRRSREIRLAEEGIGAADALGAAEGPTQGASA